MVNFKDINGQVDPDKFCLSFRIRGSSVDPLVKKAITPGARSDRIKSAFKTKSDNGFDIGFGAVGNKISAVDVNTGTRGDLLRNDGKGGPDLPKNVDIINA